MAFDSLTKRSLTWLFALLIACTGLCVAPSIAFAADPATQEGILEEEPGDGDGHLNVGEGESNQPATDADDKVDGVVSGEEDGNAASDALVETTGSTDPAEVDEPKVDIADVPETNGEDAAAVSEAPVEQPAAVTSEAENTPIVLYQVKVENQAAVTPQGGAKQTEKSTVSFKTESIPSATVKVKFRVHVQNLGDQKPQYAEVGGPNKYWVVGTTGKSLRLEALYMSLDTSLKGSIQYQVHVQNVGWQTVRADGTIAGTTGKSYRLEGLRIALVGDVSKYYDIYYQTHVQNEGWQSWKKNGEFAGTSGKSLRLEGLRVYLAKKTANIGVEQEGIVNVVYRGHVQNIGNQAFQISGGTAGTSGKSLRLEQLVIYLNKGKYAKSGITMAAHIQNIGWKENITNGQAGTTGKGLRLEAFKMQLTGPIKDIYDIEYRAHVQNIGWQPWVLNNGTAGTTGRSLRIEALQIKLVKKGGSASVSDGAYVITLANNANTAYSASGTAVKKGSFSSTNAAGKFYVRNENGGVTLQSVSTGKFMAGAANGTVSLQAWNSKSNNQVWKLSWNSGYLLTNKATSKILKLSGSNATTDAKGQSNMMTRVNLVNDGNYIMTNVGKKTVLDVNGASFNSGANIMVHAANNGGNQVFTFKNKGSDWCAVTNVMSGKAVDAASTKSGANVRQYNVTNSNAQQWGARIDRDGKLYFINRANSKNALSAESNNNVTSKSYTGANTQKWTLKAGSWSFTGDTELDRYILGIAKDCNYDLRTCFNWLGRLGHVNNATNDTIVGIASNATMNRQARQAMTRGIADCYVDASMFAWLARACGYEAYFRGGGCPSASGGIVPHGWNEVKVNGTWYVCDANLKRDLPSYNWYMITYSSSPVTYSIW